MDLSRSDLGLIAAATREPREVARLAVQALLRGHTLDGQVEQNGAGYVVTVTEIDGEVVVSELVLTVQVRGLDEELRLRLLLLHVRGLLIGAERWRRRSDVAIEQALQAARARLGMPDEG